MGKSDGLSSIRVFEASCLGNVGGYVAKVNRVVKSVQTRQPPDGSLNTTFGSSSIQRTNSVRHFTIRVKNPDLKTRSKTPTRYKAWREIHAIPRADVRWHSAH